MQETEYQVVCGTVQQIVFQNEENSYTVCRLISYSGEEITATGYIPSLGLGEELTLGGKWVNHPSYGEQFVIETFERRLPETAKGIIDYLSSGIIKGIGSKIAVKIVEHFGEKTFDILQNEPNRLSEIKGITKQKAKKIGQQFIEMSEMRILMDFLIENKLPASLTARLYKVYGIDAMEALEENPYILCNEYYEVDFSTADLLAINIGVSKLSEERIKAGIIYIITFNLSNGHTFIPLEKLVEACCQLLSDTDVEVLDENILSALKNLELNNVIIREKIVNRDAIYLKQIHDTEDFLADVFKNLAKREYKYDFEIDDLLESITEGSSLKYAPSQKKAIIQAVKYGVSILTGGPGTGKTTTVRGMISIFETLGLDVVLAAPTGRAAKRLSELCEMEAKTIHRLLEAGYNNSGKLAFQRDFTNPIECDVIILDEVSMIDISLMKSLISAMPSDARLVIVGDADQLPPVGPGNVLRDIILSEKIPVIQLTQIFRQSQKSHIVMNAHAINKGEMPVQSDKDGDFFMMRRTDVSSIIKTITELCKKRLPEYYGFQTAQIQVISPSKRSGAGTALLNTALQEILNPKSQQKNEKRFGDVVFREGDRVMQIRNNYDIIWEKAENNEQGMGMFNGDVGEILNIFPSQECLTVQFDEKIATYTFDMLNELELAYAITVHKAQGSEFDAVIFAVSKGMSKKLLTRNLLYTAITRAKKLLVIVGDNEIVQTMVNSNNKGKRYSALRARMIVKSNDME